MYADPCYNVDNDITIEFYYKYASYKSAITGAMSTIKIFRVHFEMHVSKVFPYWEKEIIIRSSERVDYNKKELFDFRISDQ
jgi:hypothetical protein